MKIIEVETMRHGSQPNVLWVQLHTEDGLIGLGETYYLPYAVEAAIHESLARFVLGRSEVEIESIWDNIFSYCNFFGSAGAELRALSAIDIALWDLLGQRCGQPIYNLFGGRTRERIPVYNTCVDTKLYDDQHAFLGRPAALAKDLLSQGIKAMKIWPWDQFAPAAKGDGITGPAGRSSMGPSGSFLPLRNLNKGLDIVKSIREATGDEMEIIIEGHSRWDLNCSIRIAQALEPYRILWMEDMMKPDSIADLSRLAAETRVPQSVSERLFTRYAYRQVLEQRAAHIIMPDLIWTGGLTEGRKIAVLADSFHLPIAPHDCTGLVALFANLHVCAASANAMILETVRGFCQGWYDEVYTENVEIQEGHAFFPETPGLGTHLRREVIEDSRTSHRVSSWSGRLANLETRKES